MLFQFEVYHVGLCGKDESQVGPNAFPLPATAGIK